MAFGISLLKQRELLKKEYEHEREEFRHETETKGIGRKIKRGDCWFPISLGSSRYNSLDKLTVEITRTSDTDIPSNFEYGKDICFFSEDGSGMISLLPFTATVSYATQESMVAILPSEKALAEMGACARLGVQLHFDETTYRLMFEALDRCASAKENRLAYLRDMIHGNLQPAFSSSIGSVSLPWLNKSQEDAVGLIVRARDIAIVHGPPGTGKTTTLVEAAAEVLRREPQIMMCAQSNAAVDWIALQMEERGYSVLRIGNPTRVNDKMLACTYERRFEAHPDYPTLWAIRRTMRQLQGQRGAKRAENYHQKMARLREKADRLEGIIRHSLFDSSRVIACTLAGSGNSLLAGQHFHTLFIDEAAAALEAACWIAIPKADRIILAGDHQQLPPTIKSPEAIKGGLSISLMESVAKAKPQCVKLLTMQYRMNETLMRFSSEWFYGGKLTAAPEVKDRSLIDELDEPLSWIDTSQMASQDDGEDEYEERFTGQNYGRINKGEARLAIKSLQDYISRKIGLGRAKEERIDIGIISPYRAQVQYLRSLLKANEYLAPIKKQITINTVDAFQGQERDIIIVSLVRANEQGLIGFLADLRRMNVAMTRARYKLIIIGNAETLGKHKFYKALHERCLQATALDRQNEYPALNISDDAET